LTDTDAERLGNLLIAQAARAENQHCGGLGGHAPKRFVECFALLVGFHDVRRVDRLGRAFDRLINLSPLAPAPATETVERSVRGRLVQPRRGEIGVGRVPAVKSDENLLDDVFRLSAISEDAIGDPDAPRILGAEQRLESIALSFHEAKPTACLNWGRTKIHAHHP